MALVQLGEGAISRCQRELDLRFGVGAGNESGFECGWGEVDASVEHRVKETVVPRDIASGEFSDTGIRSGSVLDTVSIHACPSPSE